MNSATVQQDPETTSHLDSSGSDVGSHKTRPHWPVSLLSSSVSILNTLLPIVLVRILPPDEIGLFRIFFLYLLAIPTLFFSTGIINGFAFWSGQSEVRSPALRLSVTLLLCIAILASSLLGLFATPLSKALEWNESETLLLAFSAFGAIAGTAFEELAISAGRIWYGALFYAGFEIARTLAIVITALGIAHLEPVLLCHAVMSTLKVGAGIALGYKLGIIRLGFDKGVMQRVVRYALPVSCAGFLHLIVNYLDKFTLSTILSRSDFALYSIGCLSLGPLLVVEHSITRVLIPQLALWIDNKDERIAASLYNSAARQLGLFFIPATVGLILFAEPIVLLLYTETYQASASVLKVYALWYLVHIVPFDAVARARGDSRWPLITFGKLACFSLPATLFFTYTFGAFGALCTLIVSNVALRIATIRYSLAHTTWKISDMIPYRSWFLMAAFCALGATCALAFYPLFSSPVGWFLTFAPIGLLSVIIVGIALDNQAHSPAPRVLMLVQSLQTGGIERMVTHLSIALAEDTRYTPFVVAYDHHADNSLVDQLSAKNIRVITRTKKKGFSFRLLFFLLKFVFSEDIGVIHVQDLGGLIYGTIVKVLSINRVRLIITQHSFVHLGRHRRYRFYEKIFTSFADRISVVAQPLITAYTDLGIATDRIVYIPNGVNFPETIYSDRNERVNRRDPLIKGCSIDNNLQDAVWILYLARLFPQKGQDHCLNLWSMLPDSIRAKACLLFVGPPADPAYDQLLKTQAKNLPHSNRVLFLGATSEPFTWLNVADIYISCSEYEGMPLSCIEAVGSGLPTLLSNIPGHMFLSEYVTLFNLKDPAEGAEHLSHLIEQASTHGSSLQDNWRKVEILRATFSFKTMVAKYTALYESVQPSS